MKNKILFGVVSSLFSLLIACNNQQKPHENEEPPYTEEEVKAPEQIIPIVEAESFYNNYSKKMVSMIEANEAPNEDGSKFMAARYGDYDIETIKTYIAYVEQEAKAAGVKVETLRFYFSTYPDKKEFPDKEKIKHPRQNSFFILPTMKVDSMNYGFYIKNLADGKKEAALIRDYPGLTEKGMGATSTAKKSYASIIPNLLSTSSTLFADESLILNKGNMGPPPYDPDFN